MSERERGGETRTGHPVRAFGSTDDGEDWTTRLGERSGGGGRRLRGAARSCLPRGSGSACGRVRPCPARDGYVPGGNRRDSGSGRRRCRSPRTST
jgi:hypothetical protein